MVVCVSHCFLSLSEDTEDRWKITLSWDWTLFLHNSDLIVVFAIQGMVLRVVDVCFDFLNYKSEYGHAGKSKSLRDKNSGYIFLIGILNVLSRISLTAYCSLIVLAGHSGASISVIIALCFVCWAVISHSEEVLWSHGISPALVRLKTDGFLRSAVFLATFGFFFGPYVFVSLHDFPFVSSW